MAEKSKTHLLERGDIYFFYRPRVQEKEKEDSTPKAIEEVQRFYMIMHPYDKSYYRLLLIGRKRLPDPETHERHWATVDTVTDDVKKLRETFKAVTYSTKTRGKREQPEMRACGEGVYCIVSAGRNTYFAYQLELPQQPQTVQEEFNIAPEASYVISVKNQLEAGTSSGEAAKFPKNLQNKLRDLRFAPVNPPEFLNYAGAEIILIGAASDVEEELGITMEKEEGTIDTAKIFNDLKLWKNEHTTKPLFTGKWA